MKNTFDELVPGLAWAGGIILLALGASFAQQQGYIDRDITLRLVIGANGLMIAYFGNRAPKAVAAAFARSSTISKVPPLACIVSVMAMHRRRRIPSA